MPITYTLDSQRKLIRTRCVGETTLAEVIGHFDELQAVLVGGERLDVLLDLSEVTSPPETSQLRAVSDRIEAMGVNVFGACAIVASADVMYGMSRVFGAVSWPHFERIEVFRDLQAAEAALANSRPLKT